MEFKDDVDETVDADNQFSNTAHLAVNTNIDLEPWFHVEVKLFYRIVGMHGTTPDIK